MQLFRLINANACMAINRISEVEVREEVNVSRIDIAVDVENLELVPISNYNVTQQLLKCKGKCWYHKLS